MTAKNIQMKIKNGATWDDLFPKTKATITVLNNGKTVETVITEVLTTLGTKTDLTTVQSEIQKIVGSAPGALDTLQELATALSNDANFATTITNALANKVDKVAGKGLSTEDFTTDLKTKLTSLTGYIHPTGDGNMHVPVTSTTNSGKFLKAGSTAGSLSWSALAISDVAGLQSSIDTKANTSNVYTKGEIDAKLTGVVTSGNVYTKSEVDTKVAAKARIIVSQTEDTTADFWFQEI